MNRYKIILESEEFLDNDEIEIIARHMFDGMWGDEPSLDDNINGSINQLKVVEAINLEGRVENNASTHQFYCATHNIGWSVNEDGQCLGCPICNRELRRSLLE